MKEILIDSSKLNSWLNARKLTVDSFFQNKKNLKKKLKNNDYFHCNYKDAKFITKKLNIDTKEIIKVKQVPEYILWNKKYIESTKRPIKRDGIHFYNYYSLPSPDNFKSPVILDILCPKTKIPKLNNGHLEQAITVVLGPGDIYGRWGKKKKSSNFKKININKQKSTSWIVGDTYLEPTYLPHTYSLASNTPSRILSYTAKSPIEKFVRNFNNWSKKSYTNFSKKILNKNILETILKEILHERFVDLKYLNQLLRIKNINIKTIINNKKYLKKICNLFDIDQSLFIKKNYKEDEVGKTYMSIRESMKLKRKYKNYEIAPMASSIRYPDLYGIFIKVYKNISKTNLLNIFNCHYLVTSGQLIFLTNKKKISISKGDCLWVSPFINHGFSGKGSLIRISNGESLDNQDLNEISNLYKPKQTLTRSYNDKEVWGYE